MENRSRPGLEPVEQLIERLGAGAAFGAPTQVEGGTVIPAAEVQIGFDYSAGADSENGAGRAHAWGKAAPRGFIQATEQGIGYRPAVDPVRIVIASLLTWGWTVYWITHMVRALARRPKG